MVASPNPEPQTAYVVMIGEYPCAVALSLEAAQVDALARETKYAAADEYHWTEHTPGRWRLMSRSEGRKRFAWTQRWVAVVPAVGNASDGGAA